MIPDAIVQFTRRYKEDFGRYPNGFAGYSYDIMYCLLDVVSKTEAQDAESLANAIRSVRGYKGITGELSFGEDGSIVRESFLMQVVDGMLQYADR